MNDKELGKDESGDTRAGQLDAEPAQGSFSGHAPLAARASCPTHEQISSLDPSVLQAYLGRRRWFASKDQELGVVRVAAYACVHEAGFAFAEVEVGSPKGVERYFLPLAVVSDVDEIPEATRDMAVARIKRQNEDAHLIDAFAIPGFARGVLAMLKDRTVLTTENLGEFRFAPTDHIDAADFTEGTRPRIRWLSAEQSNSSLVIDEKVVLKLVRRLIGGIHPEAEMTRYLTARGYANAGPLFGEVVRLDSDGVQHTLCILQGFIPNEGDAWDCALRWLRRAMQDAPSVGSAPGRRDPDNDAQNSIDGYRELAAILGRRLGELHIVLASPTGEDAFSPRMATADEVHSWTNGAVDLISTALDILAGRLDTLNDADRARAQSLLERRPVVLAHTQTLVSEDAHALCFRIHGDFHLGQVLIAQGDAYLIDFEGEPARPLKERRKKASPLRDVAGLLRSLRYASATVLAERGSQPERAGNSTAELVEDFYSQAEAAFLSAYRHALGIAHLKVTGDEGTFEALLQLFLLEKAAYEVCYEAANRPSWIGVPLRGLSELAEQGLAKP
ncbi:putative maltokinase [Caballeronia glathei]|uniref:putative maltokinase n=1 Tax=Caballeronia glathei TaxID=60547 RepID=UPI0009DF9C67|nr:putative maltokinase [Caballeronia glathei]